MKVEKRDGTIQDFKFEKIERVVNKIFTSKPVCEDVPDNFIDSLRSYFDTYIKKHSDEYIMPIEDIQDIIRDFLIKKNKIKATESFIQYRKKREEIREQKSWLTKEIAKKLKATHVENQNANVDEASFGGRIGEAASVVTKDYALKHIVSKMARDNHNNNMIYIHDLDNYAVGSHNCLSLPFDYLLANGFNTRQTDVRPAKSVNTACQLIAVIFQIQSLQQFGGVSATHIDWTMVPYIRRSFEKHYITEYIKDLPEFMDIDILRLAHDDLHKWISKRVSDFFIEHSELNDDSFKFENKDMLDKFYYQKALFETTQETYQAIEGLYHNLNTLQSRSGNQLPFTSLNYGTCTEPEGRLFTKAILEVSLKGLGRFGRTSIFPCGIFQYMKDVNDKPGTPNYDLYRLALKSTSKRLYPNYANQNWKPNDTWVKLDRKDKEAYISNLSQADKNKLIEKIENNPKLQKVLGLYVEEK
ncbi:MAG: NrdD-like anaerobic ribonucleotide reductase large subunit [Wendovervirus sonii]|uniref:NrdD-like anaerobic ribonucleotide reductase large subunit n=1 Tax=phage Lak_Megaphage_Sonny TaxID=3109229 RepID=A0ABZ0Z579_9CAUD|nr:MAG: NrdD-like anaerobic ribonucleotide reductase large subunit [phage Lak_Megaphage_Sonny]